MRLLIVGGSGMLGRRLAHQARQEGHTVTVSTRSEQRPEGLPQGVDTVHWDTESKPTWDRRFDALVNVAGQNLFGTFWTRSYKERLWRSRVDVNEHLVAWIRAQTHPPDVFVTASAVGYYGTAPPAPVAEDAPPGDDFLARLCVAWERAARGAEGAGTRVACARFGIMMDPDGGALGRLLPIFRLGMGGRIGSGRQPFPWVTTHDAARAILRMLGDDAIHGAVNVVAPQRIDNRHFTKALASAVRRPAFVPVPSTALRVLYGDGAEALVQGQEVAPARLMRAGFAWDQPEIEAALESLLHGPPSPTLTSAAR